MRHRFTVVFLIIVCAVVALTPLLASAGTAGETRYARTGPTTTSQTTAVTLASGKSVVACYEERAVLTGKVTPAQGRVRYEIWVKGFAQPAFKNFSPPEGLETRNDGSFMLSPGMCGKTAYQIRVPTQTGDVVRSNVVTVNSRAYMRISRTDDGSKRLFQVQATGINLGGRFVLIQRATGSGRWVTLRRATLRGRVGAFMTARFSLSLRYGHVRAVLPRAQAAPGFLRSVSPTVAVKP